MSRMNGKKTHNTHNQKESLLMSCRSYLEEVRALTGSDVVGKKIMYTSLFVLFLNTCSYILYFSSDRTTKVLGNLLFGKNYTSLEFGQGMKIFRGHSHQGKLLMCTSTCEEHNNNIKHEYKVT